MRFTRAHAAKLADVTAEAVRAVHDQQIKELQTLPASAMAVINDIVVPNAGFVLVNHPLGRAPRIVLCSPPKVPFGTPGLVAGGILIESTSGGGSNIDRTKQIRLFATGYGVAITVDVAVL